MLPSPPSAPPPSAPPSARAKIALGDRAATRRLGARLAGVLRPGDVVALRGALGAGKTALARDVIEARAHAACEVPSPTFTLVQAYETGDLAIWHFDLYRLERPEDIEELGFDEALDDGAVLVEWPERLGDWLPAERLDIALDPGPDPASGDETRIARLTATGDWIARLDALTGGAVETTGAPGDG